MSRNTKLPPLQILPEGKLLGGISSASAANAPSPTGTEQPQRSRNARAQARHRAKRKAYIEQLEDTVTKLQATLNLTPDQVASLPPAQVRIRELEADVHRLRAEVDALRTQLEQLGVPAATIQTIVANAAANAAAILNGSGGYHSIGGGRYASVAPGAQQGQHNHLVHQHPHALYRPGPPGGVEGGYSSGPFGGPGPSPLDERGPSGGRRRRYSGAGEGVGYVPSGIGMDVDGSSGVEMGAVGGMGGDGGPNNNNGHGMNGTSYLNSHGPHGTGTQTRLPPPLSLPITTLHPHPNSHHHGIHQSHHGTHTHHSHQHHGSQGYAQPPTPSTTSSLLSASASVSSPSGYAHARGLGNGNTSGSGSDTHSPITSGGGVAHTGNGGGGGGGGPPSSGGSNSSTPQFGMPSSGPAPGIGAGGGLGGSLGVGVGGVGMASLTGSSGSRGRPSSFDAQGALQLPPPIPHHGRHLQFGSGGSSSPGGAGGGLGIPPIQHLQSHSGGHHGHHQGGYEAIKTEEEYGHGPLSAMSPISATPHSQHSPIHGVPRLSHLNSQPSGISPWQPASNSNTSNPTSGGGPGGGYHR